MWTLVAFPLDLASSVHTSASLASTASTWFPLSHSLLVLSLSLPSLPPPDYPRSLSSLFPFHLSLFTLFRLLPSIQGSTWSPTLGKPLLLQTHLRFRRPTPAPLWLPTCLLGWMITSQRPWMMLQWQHRPRLDMDTRQSCIRCVCVCACVRACVHTCVVPSSEVCTYVHTYPHTYVCTCATAVCPLTLAGGHVHLWWRASQ